MTTIKFAADSVREPQHESIMAITHTDTKQTKTKKRVCGLNNWKLPWIEDLYFKTLKGKKRVYWMFKPKVKAEVDGFMFNLDIWAFKIMIIFMLAIGLQFL